jgi:hypothetical protein
VGEKTYGECGDVLVACQSGMRVPVETREPPAWKGAIDEKLHFFVCARIQALGFGLFAFEGANERLLR